MVRRKRDSLPRAEKVTSRKPPTATCQTRVRSYSGVERTVGDAVLMAYAELYGQVERKLFAEVAVGQSAASLKNKYLGRY